MTHLLKKLLIFLLLCALLGYFFSTQWHAETTVHKEDWLKIQNDRKTRLDSICLSKNLRNLKRKLNVQVTRQLFVDENYKFIYCEVPKVGCSNWKKIVLLLTLNLSRDTFEVSQNEIHKTNLLKRLSSYPPKQQEELLNSFTKVMFTRHPLERLVSAYRDKLLGNEPYYSGNVANEIKALFRKDKNFTGVVTFQEFVNYVVTSNKEYLDVHWKPMSQLCDPCNIHYDILGKYETLEDDAKHTLSRIRVPEIVRYPDSKFYTQRTNKNFTIQYLRKLDWNQIQKLLELYQIDFSLFNYTSTAEMEMLFSG